MRRQSDRVDWWFDRFSVVHAAVGVLFELSRVPAPLALGSHLAFESTENQLKDTAWLRSIWPDVRPDAWQNHVGDFTSFTAGYYAARALRARGSGSQVALVGLVAAAGAIWTWALMARDRESTDQGRSR